MRCVLAREFLLLQPVPTSPLWKMLPSSFKVSPLFSRETVSIVCQGPCLRHRVGCRGRGSPSALPGREAQRSPLGAEHIPPPRAMPQHKDAAAALPPSLRDAICGQAGCGYTASEATTPQNQHETVSSMVRKPAVRYSQFIIMVSMACEESEMCSSVCITLPTEQALLVHK